MKKKQQLESSNNRLINRLYRSKPRAVRQEGESSQQALILPSLHTEQRQLIPKVNLKQKLPSLEPFELSFRRSKVVSFLEKKNTEARGLLNRSHTKAKSRMYSSVENSFEHDRTLPAAVTVELTRPEKPQANYLTPEDFMQIIKLDKEMSQEFCYLRKKDSPYNWEIVDFQSRDPDEYMVISKRGLTKYVGGVGEFMSMEAFNAQARTYQRLMEIDYFKTYKKWKNFSIWKRLTKMNRLRECIRAIDNCILLSDQIIKEGINAAYLKCKELETLSIFYNKIMTVMHLAEFKAYVQSEREKTMEAIRTFDRELTRIIEDTCNRSLEFFKKRMRIDRERGKETSEKKVPLVIGDETGKEMPYTEQATIKTQQLKLRNFIKLVDYLVLTAKSILFKSSTTELEKVITETNTIYANRLGKTYGRSCWVRIEIEEHGDELFFLPPKSAVKDSLEEILFETVMEVCRTHIQFLHEPSFSVYARQRESERTDQTIELKNIINADMDFTRLIASFRHSVNVSLENVEQHSHILHDSLELLKRLRKLSTTNLSQKDSEYFRSELTSVREELAKVRAIQNEVEVGLYLFDCSNYKKLIEQTSNNVTLMLGKLVPELLHQRSRDYLKEINRNYKEIEDSPPNLQAYFSFLEKVKEVNNEAERMQPNINDTIYLLSIADQFGLKPSDIVRGEVSEVNGQMIGLRRRLDEIGYSGQALLEKFKKQIEKLIPTFDDRLKLHEQKLSQLMVYKNTTNVYDKVVELNTLSKSLKALNKDRQDLNRYQQALALQETAFEGLDKFTSVFYSVEKMWKARYDWDLLHRTTAKDQIKNLKLTVIKLKVQEMDKVVSECTRELQPNEVISDLKSQVQIFRPLYSVMVNLNDEALLENHREQIRQLVVVDTIEAAIKLEEEMLKELFQDMNSEVLTPEFLKEIKLSRHSEAIQQITTKAIKEAELSKMLLQLESFWKSNSLQVVLYRDNKDSPVLGINDELISRIEDNLITTNNILASKYVGFIRGKVELQYKMLHYLHDLLDEWYHHQHTWMYLQPILKSPFAIKNLPKESSTFAQADALWKRLMKQARDNPSAKKYGDEYVSRFTLNQLRNNNASFEVLQKSLEEFLQKKRQIFGRFFLLSNLQLLEILSNVKEHRDISRYLSKVFQSVVDIHIDDKDSVTGLKGPDGQTINIKQCLFKGEVEEWFKLIEDMMKSSLRTMVRHEMAAYNSEGMERSNWIKCNPPCQVMLAVDSLAWTASTELFLDGGEDLDFYDWFEGNNQQVQQEIAMLKQMAHPHLHISLSSLLNQNIHQRDILEALLGCQSRDDFRWQVRLRFYYEDDTVVARVIGAQTSYGYEYVGLYASPVSTMETDRYWFSIISCISKQKVALLQGQHDTGKTQTYRQLALTFAKNSMVFDCSSSVTPSVLRKLLTGASYMGSWICFEQVTNLPEEVLSVFAQHLFRIQEALALSAKDVRIGDKPLLLNPQFGLVMTTRHLNFTKFPSNLLSELRPVSVWLPNKAKLFETVLTMNSIADSKDITRRILQFLNRCSEQLISHPTFSTRDLMTIAQELVKEVYDSHTTQIEQLVIRVMKNVVQVRFASKDIPMWRLLLSEAFPINLKLMSMQSIIVPRSVQSKLREMYLVETDQLIDKVKQLQEVVSCKPSVIVNGATMSGKTTVLKAAFEDVVFISPNCFTNEELLGRFELSSGNWKDGLLPKIIRQNIKETTTTLVLDGSISYRWAEAIAPLLDPNHSTTLASSQQLSFDKKQLRLCFECSDLSSASPAITSRCGLVYVSSSTVGYQPIVEAFFSELDDRIRSHFIGLVKSSYKKGIAYLRKNCRQMVVGSAYGLLLSYCKLVRFQLKQQPVSTHLLKESWKKLAEKICIFAFTWSLGGVLAPETTSKFDKCLTECFSSDHLKTPMSNYVLNYQKPEGEWVLWSSFADNYQPEGRKFIPTKETAIMKHMMLLFTKQLSPFLLMSPPGNGKSTAIRYVLTEELPSSLPLQIKLPVYSSGKDLQDSIEGKLFAQRRSGVVSLLPPPGQKLICIIDDINLTYAEAVTSTELIRSLFATNVLWDRKAWTPKNVVDYQIVYTLSCNRQLANLPERFLRYFNMLFVPECEEESLHAIFNTFTKTLPAVNTAIEIYLDSKHLATATVDLFRHVKAQINASPLQPQIAFNQHHMMDILRGVERAFNPNKDLTVNQVNTLIRLWIHEVRQTIISRMGSTTERENMQQQLQKLVIVSLKYQDDPTILFSEHILFSPLNINHYYSHVPNPVELINELQGQGEGNVHLSRKFANHLFSAVRALSQPRGNYIVLANDGQGRTTLINFAAKLLDLTVQEMLPTTKLLPVLKKLCDDKKPLLVVINEPQPKTLEELIMLPRITKEDQEEISKTTNAKSFVEIIEKYLHIAVTYSPRKEGFRRAIRTLPCVTTLFAIDYWMDQTVESLTEIASKLLSTRSSAVELEAVGMDLYQLTGLSSIGPYLDLFRMYESHHQKVLWLTERKYNAIGKAINKFDLTVSKLKSISLKMQEDIPKKESAIAVGEQCFLKLQKAQQVAIQYKSILDGDEKQLEDESQRVADEKRDIDRTVAELAAPVENSATAIVNLTRNELSEMKQLYASPNTPPDLRFALQCLAIVLQEKEDGDSIKKMVNDAGFAQRPKQLDFYNIPKRVIQSLKTKLAINPSFRPAELKAVNIVAKYICEWIWAINNFPDAYKMLDDRRQSLQKLTDGMNSILKVVTEKRAHMEGLNAEIRRQQNQYHKCLEDKEGFEKQIENAIGQLERGEKLVESSNSCYQRWKVQLQKTQKELQNLKCDVFYACCETVLLSRLHGRQREEVMSKWKSFLLSNLNFKLREDYNCEEVLAGLPKYRRILHNNSWHPDQSMLTNLLYADKSIFPLIMMDPYGWALDVFKCDQQSTVILEYNSATFETDFGQLMKSEKTTCIVHLQSSNQLSEVHELLNWNMSLVGRPDHVGKQKVVVSPSFRWHFLIQQAASVIATTGYRIVNFLPSEQSVLHRINLAINRSERVAGLIESAKLAQLKKVESTAIVAENEWFVTDSYESVASELFEEPDLIVKIQKCSSTVSKALEELRELRVPDVPIQTELVNRLYQISQILERIKPTRALYRNLTLNVFLQVCTKLNIESFKPEAAMLEATVGLQEQLRNHVITRKHLLAMFFELAIQVACKTGSISNEHVALLPRAMNTRSSRQVFTELAQLAKWTNPRMKDWEIDYFWEDPIKYCQAKEWTLSPFEHIICMVRIPTRELIPAIEAFIKNTLGIDVSHPTQSFSIRQLYTKQPQQPIHILDLVDDTGQINIVKEVQKLAGETGLPRFKVYSLGDKDMHSRIEVSIRKSINDGGWTVMSNCHLEPQFTQQKIEEIRASEKIHDRFRLTIVHNSHAHIEDRYYIKSSFDLQEQQLTVLKDVPKILVQLHHILNDHFKDRFRNEDLLQVLKLLEPVLKKKRLEDAWSEIRLALVDYVYFAKLNNKQEHQYLGWLFDEHKESSEGVGAGVNGQLIKPAELTIQLNLLHPQPTTQDKYAAVLKLCESFSNRLPVAIKKKAAPTDKQPLIGATTDYLEPYITEEAELNNSFIKQLEVQLKDLRMVLKGEAPLDNPNEQLINAIAREDVPQQWKKYFSPADCLAEAFNQFLYRCEQLRNYLNDRTKIYQLLVFSHPVMFLQTVLFGESRRRKVSSFALSFDHFFKLPATEKEMAESDGIYIKGLLCRGFTPDVKTQLIRQTATEQQLSICPLIHFRPVEKHETPEGSIELPLYCTTQAGEQLSIPIRCRTTESREFWNMRKSCLKAALRS